MLLDGTPGMIRPHWTLGLVVWSCTGLAFPVLADPPAGYYDSVVTTCAAAMRNALHDVIDDHQRFPYTSRCTDTWDILKLADQASAIRATFSTSIRTPAMPNRVATTASTSGNTLGPVLTASPATTPRTMQSKCDDRFFCNRLVDCVGGFCRAGGVPCPGQNCVEATDACITPSDPEINELHYNDADSDEGEFIEIAGPAGTDLANWQVFGYNGADGNTYGTQVFLSGTLSDQGGCGPSLIRTARTSKADSQAGPLDAPSHPRILDSPPSQRR